MNEVIAMIRRFGAGRLAGIIGVGAGVAIALTLITARLSEPSYGVLYADIELAEAQSVIDRLDQDGIPYKTRERAGRMSILAPQAEIPKLRISLAADGEAPRGGVGYEIFDKEDQFGSTSFQQNINRLRALEGELSRTIASIDGVRGARVHLVLPERALFARDRENASASIVIDAVAAIDAKTVRAIVNLASSAVPGLAPSKVTVLDAAGELLASGADDDGLSLGGADEKTAATQTRLRQTLEDIIGRVVGADNLRVQVAAEMDFSRVTENAEVIDPDSQTVLSSVTVEEAADESQPSSGRGVTVANALPGAQGLAEGYPSATSNNRRTEETTNYEMSRTTRTQVREQGVVKRLSVAIALNAGAAPRTGEDLARIAALARSAVGFNESRGDKVEVVEVAFAPVAAAPAEGAPMAPAIQNLGHAAEIGALALIGLALVVFVLRPIFAAPKAKATPAERAAQGDGVARDLAATLPAPGDARFDLALVEGHVKASSIARVAEVVRGHTDESAGILKGWIRQAS